MDPFFELGYFSKPNVGTGGIRTRVLVKDFIANVPLIISKCLANVCLVDFSQCSSSPPFSGK